MQDFVVARYAAFGITVVLGGCFGAGGSQPSTTSGAPIGVRFIRTNCCANAKTLFVTDPFGGSNGKGTVYAFDYKAGKQLGQLAAPPEGWFYVQGACADDKGNAYFANILASTIDEYTHDGAYVETLADTGQNPLSCAYDRTTGDLAVANEGTGSGLGGVSIFKGGVFQNTYYPPNIATVYFLGYQGATGVLWLDGYSASGVFQYDKFVNGTFTPVPIQGASIDRAGDVQWSAKTHAMNVTSLDQSSTPTIYQVSPTGHVVGKTVLSAPSGLGEVAAFVIKGPSIVISNDVLNVVSLYAYPSGGQPILQYASFTTPTGLTISPDVP